jgi:hypothetical protein
MAAPTTGDRVARAPRLDDAAVLGTVVGPHSPVGPQNDTRVLVLFDGETVPTPIRAAALRHPVTRHPFWS